MPLSRGTQLGSCEIMEMIGAGGMGEVYRGRDKKLGRDVAVKALPGVFATDAERMARFEREAQVLATLNHPNIAVIHELKEANGAQYLILELVEGETLAERIARGPIASDQALDIASQIAGALEAAHEKGIVHRDLKPANVKIDPEGRVKVLDFGLAKTFESTASPQDSSNSPTISAGQTARGVILGTAAYMSPEQARGNEVDRRSDVWSFGCVLYEMLTGRQAFPTGETVSDTLAGILAREPDWQALPNETPTKVRTLLERCLRKDERRRWSGMAGVRIEIEEARGEREASVIQAAAPLPSRRRERVLAGLALVFLLLSTAITIRLIGASGTDSPAFRSEFYMRQGSMVGSLGHAELSPDGRKVAFLLTFGNKRLISVRQLETTVAEPLSSTEGTGPEIFWSADSQYIAFSAEGKLKKVAAGGGPSQVVADLSNASLAGAWNADGVILLGGASTAGPLLRVAATGGNPVPATELDASLKETSHAYPSFLPDGRHFLYLATSSDSQNRYTAYVGELDSKERHALPGIASRVRYSSSGHLVFIRDGALMAQAFDAKRFELSGGAFPVADKLVAAPGISGPFSVSMNGGLAYSRPLNWAEFFTAIGLGADSQLAWFDRTGRQLELAGPAGSYAAGLLASFGTAADLRFSGGPSLSPDGKSVAFSRDNPPDIWVLDLDKSLSARLTSDAAADNFPVWSPDGRRIAFRSERDGVGNLYEREVGVVVAEKLIWKDEASKFPTDWSRDGRYLAYHTSDGDIWALPLSGDEASRKPVRVTQGSFIESDAKISPDGRWIAYVSNEAGPPEVYIQSFPEPGFKQPVSTGGGANPRWSPDGKELFYMVGPSLQVVSIQAKGSALQISAPASVFPLRGPMLHHSATGSFLSPPLARGIEAEFSPSFSLITSSCSSTGPRGNSRRQHYVVAAACV